MTGPRETEGKDLKVEVIWQPTPEKRPLWDKLWGKILAPKVDGAGQPPPSELGYEYRKSGGKAG